MTPGYELVTNASPSNSAGKTVSVDCSSGGKKVVGGGFSIAGSADVAGYSFPSDSNTWEATAYEVNNENGNWSITAYAICVDG